MQNKEIRANERESMKQKVEENDAEREKENRVNKGERMGDKRGAGGERKKLSKDKEKQGKERKRGDKRDGRSVVMRAEGEKERGRDESRNFV